jgi:single-stranded DNA-specific DHH superfamily exonuclease
MVNVNQVQDYTNVGWYPISVIDDTKENYVLHIVIRKMAEDFPKQIGLSLFYNPDLPLRRRIWNAFKYLFGFHPSTVEFELKENQLENFKDRVRYTIDQWEKYDSK